jgi:hypothetical protein
MARQKSCGPHWGKLVHQLLGVITFAYDLYLGHTIARWKGIDKENHLGPQNGPGSSGTEKLLKIVSCQKIVLSELDKVDGHQDPPGSD